MPILNSSHDHQQITVDSLEPVAGVPLTLEIDSGKLSALSWADEYKRDIQGILNSHGAVLIRGLTIASSTHFGKVLSILFGSELIDYVYRSTPRTALRGNVYTASEYPADQIIPQHNENSYSRHWPTRIGFMCMQPPETGGETPICDSRIIYKVLPPSIRAMFEEKGIQYVRTYSSLDLPWSEVFQTENKHDVEAYCKENDLAFAWLANNSLRTSQVNPAVAIHPRTGEKLWFNQAHLFHVSSVPDDIATTLLSSLGEQNLPRQAYYGDGCPIEAEALNTVRRCYDENKITFTWRKNDLLLLDNMLFSHGRKPYKGIRQVLVGMASPNSLKTPALNGTKPRL
jgi:alpha-ketoglutarate-dependent taurine dioxygenase